MNEIWYVLRNKFGETVETNTDRSVLEKHKADRERYLHKSGDFIEILDVKEYKNSWQTPKAIV